MLDSFISVKFIKGLVRGTVFLDEDECSQISGLCGNGTCVNTVGSFLCNCHDGFRRDRRGYCEGESVDNIA